MPWEEKPMAFFLMRPTIQKRSALKCAGRISPGAKRRGIDGFCSQNLSFTKYFKKGEDYETGQNNIGR
jgi:hypothetical protein